MKTIGFKNFRKFADFPMMELAPITIFVGENNAGKSTVVKGILAFSDFLNNENFFHQGPLWIEDDEDEEQNEENRENVKNYFRNVKFYFNSSYLAHIGTFKRALYNKATEDTITFRTKIGVIRLDVLVEGKRDDEEAVFGNVSKIDIFDDKYKISISLDLQSDEMYLTFNPCPNYQAKDLEKNRGRLTEPSLFEESSKKEVTRNKDDDPLARYFGSFDKVYTLTMPLSYAWRPYSSRNFLGSILGSLERSIDDKLHKLSSSQRTGVGFHGKVISHDDGVYTCSIGEIDEEMKRFLEMYMDCYNQTRFGRIHIQGTRDFFRLPISAGLLSAKIVDVEYIYAHAVTQTVIYSAKDTNDYLSRTIHEFAPLSRQKIRRDFVLKWMKEYGIGKNYTIRSVGGEAHIVTITNEDGEKVNLADKGMGSIQLMVLLFRLAILLEDRKPKRFERDKGNKVVIIEEPEQNLHPMLQSKLADLLYELYKEHGIRFIIETHSEYLIRKTQVIVKNNNTKCDCPMGDNPFKVYYFNSEGDQPYYEIIYQKDGCFANDFGKGFFDEASNLAFEIL